MSSAASTIPAKRNVFRTKFPKIPSLDDEPKKANKTKTYRRGNANVLIVKHKDVNDSLEEDSGHGHFENEETWMGKSNTLLQLGQYQVGPVAKGNTKHKYRTTAAYKFPGDSSYSTTKIMHIKQYQSLMDERKKMLEMNDRYEKRIAKLEHEVRESASLNGDNEKLRHKVDANTGKDHLFEPYSRVFEDRKILREAESGYKKRIIRLEKEIIEKQRECEQFQDQVKALRSQVKPTRKVAEEKEVKTKDSMLQVELRKIKSENETLRNNVIELEKSNKKLDMGKTKLENDTLRGIIKKLEFQLSRNATRGKRTTTSARDETKQRNRSKLYQISFEDKPIIFDYEYLLPDSQVYD